jgi:hypothetical protein
VTIRDGRIVEYAADDGRPLPESAFTGIPARGRVVSVTHSGGELTREQWEMPVDAPETAP